MDNSIDCVEAVDNSVDNYRGGCALEAGGGLGSQEIVTVPA